MQEVIERDYQTFVSGSDTAFGAVREIAPRGRRELVIYVENAGEFVVPFEAVEAVSMQKVILDCDKLGPELRDAIDHAHDAERPMPDGSG
jgi:hypothetical protein